jgi:WD40 repeat protein
MSFPATGTQDARLPVMNPIEKFEATGSVSSVIELPGGQRIMNNSGNGSLRVWNLQTGKKIANWRDGDNAVYAIALSSDGKKVVSESTG